MIKALWTAPSASLDGQFLQFENAHMAPRPLQQPHPPYLGRCRVDAALKRAGRYGDGWFAYFVTPERFRTSLDKALEHWHQRDAASRTTFTGGVVLYFCIAPTYEEAKANALRTLSTEYNQSFDTIIDKYSALGPAAECAATIQRYIDAGARHMTLLPAVPAAADHGSTPIPRDRRIATPQAKRILGEASLNAAYLQQKGLHRLFRG